MELGVVGLGRMGSGLVRRLAAAGHHCVVTDLEPSRIEALVGENVTGARSIEALAGELTAPRAIWVMVPAEVTGTTITAVAAHLDRDDILIDGGNTFFGDDPERAERLAPAGIHYVDIGTSGGVWGEDRGYCLMVGGDDEPVARLEPILSALAPGVDAAPRSPGRSHGPPSNAERGWLHCGPSGAGHFAKMVHNGIEYGQMAALAEGLDLLASAGLDLDVAEIAELWRRGSVVSSWLLDLTAAALAADPELTGFDGVVADSGEGRWTVQTAIDQGVPVPVLSAALNQRFATQGRGRFGAKSLSAMRAAFGGHREPGT